MSATRRAALLLFLLSLSAGNPLRCLGWMATPEARMACCVDNDCPMHRAHASTHTAQGSSHHATDTVTQAEADRCCAASTPDEATAFESLAAVGPLLPVVSIVGAGAAQDPAAAHARREAPPPPGSATPRHLFLTVLLV